MTTQTKKRYVGILFLLVALTLVSVVSFTASSNQPSASVAQVSGPVSDRPIGASASEGAAAVAPVQAQASTNNNPDSATYRGLLPVERFDISPPLNSVKPLEALPGQKTENEDDLENTNKVAPDPNASREDGALQKMLGAFAIPTPIISFDGNPNLCGCSPPDPNGEVGVNHLVEMSNLHFQIFNKTGTSLYGPAANNTLWAGFGGACQTENSGDPVVLYDQLADRWLLSQFTSAGPTYYNCVALSTSPDPTGTYYRYAFTTGSNFPDYPKYGMWPDAYYIQTREFAGGSSFAGIGAYAANRAQMIAGNPNPQVISFLATPVPAYNIGDGLLPADLDGTALPPAGSPNYWVGSMDNNGAYGAPQDALTLWKFVADFVTPSNSSFTLANTLPIASYNTAFPCTGRNCIAQPGTTNRLDILSYRQRPIFRLAYRNFGTHESLVTNQSVDAGAGPGGSIAGNRWWEVRSPNSSPIIYQEGTFAPGLTDGIHRWMASVAMDRQGNMAMGYSASSTTVFPGVRYSGRLVTDPLGTMPQGEGVIHEGTGSQTTSQRWGDYTDLTVDPVDDCTFWHVNEYVPTTSGNGWRVRIGAFKFNECTSGPTPTPCVSCTNTPTRTITPTVAATLTRTVTATPTCGPGYNYVASTATIVPGTTDTGNHGDDVATNIALPFPFSLYGTAYNSANVISNGNLQFATTSTAFTNTCLPAATHGAAILPFWEDLRTDTTGTCTGGCGIYTSISGTAPNRIFNIEWRTYYFTGTGNAYFEIRLYETTNTFDIIIGTTTTNTSATTGVQNGTLFTQYQCDTTIADGLRLAFSLGSCPTPGPTNTTGPSNTPTRTFTNTPPAATNTSTATNTPNAPTATPCVINFTDVLPTDYFYVAVQYLACRGVISGYTDGTFRPFNTATRGQMAKIIVLAEGWTVVCPATATFTDVPTTHPFFCYVETAFAHGIISGYSDGTFRPGNNVTRGQTAKIVVSAEGWTDPCPATPTFTDVPTTHPFFCFVETAFSRGIISGYSDGTFRPGNDVTRGQLSKIVHAAITAP